MLLIVTEMSSSDKMISALLAMSLSYYYVMEEQMKMEKKADKILSTFLTCRGNTAPPKHITSVQCKCIASYHEVHVKVLCRILCQKILHYLAS